MKSRKFKIAYRMATALFLCIVLFAAQRAIARVGGAGGHSSSSHSSSGGHSYSSHSSSGYSSDSSGQGGSPSLGLIIIAIVIIIIIVAFKKQAKRNAASQEVQSAPATSFPEGLDADKIAGSFLAIQNAWQQKDLTSVRKWLSDGVYQRLSIQFKMMAALGQRNTLSNIRIQGIKPVKTWTDGHYYIADVAISFVMDDNFISDKYPQFNESNTADADTEYWTFIKRTDSAAEKNLYDNNNCPNCGAPFEVKMGEISRCSNCNTLTNSAAYDWVLSEITQQDDFSAAAGLSEDADLKTLTQNDPLFSVQRMEDMASNIFMQVMDVFTSDNVKRLTRFADDEMVDSITQYKQNNPPYLFDRLYINSTTLRKYTVENDVLKLYFAIKVTYRRVAINGKLEMLDSDFTTHTCGIELSRDKDVLNKVGETVYSYECSSCGAPYTDTTEDRCSYCDAPVIDKQRNWVLTGFAWKTGSTV